MHLNEYQTSIRATNRSEKGGEYVNLLAAGTCCPLWGMEFLIWVWRRRVADDINGRPDGLPWQPEIARSVSLLFPLPLTLPIFPLNDAKTEEAL